MRHKPTDCTLFTLML